TLFAEVGHQRYGLIEPNGPWEFSGLCDAGRLGGGQSVWSVQSHVRGNVVEEVVVPDAEPKTNYCVVMTKQGLSESRSVCHAQNRSKVVLIGIHTRIAQRERSLRVHKGGNSALGRIDL